MLLKKQRSLLDIRKDEDHFNKKLEEVKAQIAFFELRLKRTSKKDSSIKVLKKRKKEFQKKLDALTMEKMELVMQEFSESEFFPKNYDDMIF